MKKKISCAFMVLVMVIALSACGSSVYSNPENGARIEIMENGGSVELTTADEERYTSNVGTDIPGDYVDLGGSRYYIYINGDILQLSMSSTDNLGLNGFYEK
jgi:hypothetical protein